MNARDRQLLFDRYGGGLSTQAWRDYAALSRLGLVDIDAAGEFNAMVTVAFGGNPKTYRSVTLTPKAPAGRLLAELQEEKKT